MNKPRSLDTKVVHSGEPSPRIAGAIALPIFQSSTFEYQENAAYHDIRYIRLNNTPNHSALHKKIADLERAEAAVVTSSVMAAISTTLLTILKTGDHHIERLSDRAAAANLRYRLDWKIAFSLELDFAGVHPTTLVYFRDRLLASNRASYAFDVVLGHLSNVGLVKKNAKQRID